MTRIWRRWLRYWRRRRPNGRVGVVKPWNALVLAAMLIALDQATKAFFTTHLDGHTTEDSWLLRPLLVTLILVPFLFNERVRLAASFAIAGSVSNGVSALSGSVDNPFLAQHDNYVVAFNAADVFLATGIVLTLVAVGSTFTQRLTPGGSA